MKTAFLLTKEQALDQTLILELASLISDGNIISGAIEAPTGLLEAGLAIGHTGFKFSQNQEMHNPISTKHDRSVRESSERRRREYEGFVAILMEGKKPGFVDFDEAGWRDGFNFNQLQMITSHYLGLCYRGILHYYKGGLDRDQESFKINSTINLILDGLRGQPPHRHPRLIGLVADAALDEDTFTKPVLEFCRELKLQEVAR